jgi:hypothetical protein
MHQPLFRRAAVVASALVIAIVIFTGGVVAGRTSVPERDASVSTRSSTTSTVTTVKTADAAMSRVIVYGDSLSTQAEPYIQVVARALGLQVEVRALGGTAPCDFVPRIEDDIASKHVDLAVWAFSGNSVGSCMLGPDGKPFTGQAMLDKYRDDTEAAIEAAERADVPFILASPPAPHLPGDVWEQLDGVYRRLASAHPRIQYADAGVAISPDGEFVDTQRCLPFEQRIPQAREACDAANGRITVRGSDGHFCPVATTTGSLECTTYSSGAMRYAINLLQAARLELDYQAQIAAGAIPPP